MRAYLTVYPDTEEAFHVELDEGNVLEIGRKAGSPGQRKLVLSVPEVSGTHVELRLSQEGWHIRDLGSTNGTRLNGEWLSPGQEYRLNNLDMIKIAQVDVLVHLPEGAVGPARVPQRVEEEHEKTHLHIKLINATILVGDIRAFTSLMESYSSQPDTVMEAAQKVFQILGAEIRKQHGQVEKVAGDAIMAYWQGADAPAPEYNICALQACYAALSMRELIEALAADPEVWPFANNPLQIDVAMATGPVASGVLGAARANPALLGDTANLAFRLEKLIGEDSPGDIIMDSSTYEMVKERFNAKPLGSFTVKGRQRPVEVYRLLDVKE
jgi:class 3 adenylate cyclase